MWFAAFALKRPYAIVAPPILVCVMGIGAALGMPFDIFPELDIPVVGVEKVYLHQGADVSRTITQLASCAPVVLKYMSAEPHAAAGVALWRGGRVHHLAWLVEQLAAGHLNDLG
jgi:hypothetical protein